MTLTPIDIDYAQLEIRVLGALATDKAAQPWWFAIALARPVKRGRGQRPSRRRRNKRIRAFVAEHNISPTERVLR